MPGLLQGLEIGKRALFTNQVYLQTIGHNIANVNTPGYTRQRVQIAPTFPEGSPSGSIGTGVSVTNIKQVRDLFLGQQFREGTKSLGQWSYKEKILGQVESLFSEPNDNTLSDRLNKFWNSWDELSKSTSGANRENVLGSATFLVNGLHEMAGQLESLRAGIDQDMVTMINDINRLATEIANTNQQIKITELGGSSANDLRDIRAQMVDELAVLVDVNTIEQDNGELRVMIGRMEIVNGSHAVKVSAEPVNEGGRSTHNLVLDGSTVNIRNLGGQLKGLVDARDELVPQYLDELNLLTRTVIEQVNSLHETGYGLDGSTGMAFFDPNFTDASTIRINDALSLDPDKIAASASGEEGDGDIARQISALRTQRLMINNTSTIEDYYGSLIGRLGVESNEAQSFSDNYELLVHQIQNQRQSVEGVSLDEEMANMIKFQRAYDAAARVITTMDEALDMVISRMGVVGR